jgi:hypothetical protein
VSEFLGRLKHLRDFGTISLNRGDLLYRIAGRMKKGKLGALPRMIQRGGLIAPLLLLLRRAPRLLLSLECLAMGLRVRPIDRLFEVGLRLSMLRGCIA